MDVAGITEEIIEWLPIPHLSDYVDASAIHHDRKYKRKNICICFVLFVVMWGGCEKGYVEERDAQFLHMLSLRCLCPNEQVI